MKQKQYDPLFEKIVDEIIQCEFVSIPFLQRRFLVGYSRAARILTQLENKGYIKSEAIKGSLRKVIKGN